MATQSTWEVVPICRCNNREILPQAFVVQHRDEHCGSVVSGPRSTILTPETKQGVYLINSDEVLLRKIVVFALVMIKIFQGFVKQLPYILLRFAFKLIKGFRSSDEALF